MDQESLWPKTFASPRAFGIPVTSAHTFVLLSLVDAASESPKPLSKSTTYKYKYI